MRKITVALLILLAQASHVVADDPGEIWSEDQLEIIEVNRWVPLAPREAGFAAYADLFHPEYTNWPMGRDSRLPTTREQYLDGVKRWLDAGNYATYSKVVPISIDVFGDIAYVRHLQEEHFHHPDRDPTQFVGHFASLMKKYKGKWTFYRTSYEPRYRGPLNGSDHSLSEK